MKQNIMIVLLSVIAALLGYLAVEWKDSREIPKTEISNKFEKEPKKVGSIKIELTVDNQGNVAEAHILESKLDEKYNKKTLESVKLQKFQPKIINGIAKKTRYTINFDVIE